MPINISRFKAFFTNKKSSQMKIKILLLILVLINFCPPKTFSQVVCNTSRAQDSFALALLFDATSGKSWTKTWDLGKPMTTWFGVTLGVGGRVIRLELPNNNLIGFLPNQLTSLCAVQALDLSYNKIIGALPLQMSNMSGLTTVRLNNAELTGQIPRFIATSLTYLDLGNNQFNGTFPNLDSCFSLQTLYLNNNKIGGTLPISFFNSHFNLQRLSIRFNQFTGTIPTAISNLYALVSLDLSVNQLTGTIPTSIGSLQKLEALAISNNLLTGTIPANFGNLSNLKTLDLGFNKLTSPLPTALGNLKRLNFLALQSNEFTDILPPQYGGMDSLELFTISYNQLKGTVPVELSRLKKLAYLDVSYNRFDSLTNFTGGFPRYLESVTSRRFVISGNKFTFDDILPNMSFQSKPSFVYQYLGQDSIICAPKSSTLARNENFTIDLNIDKGLTTNVYRWFKNDKLINRTNVNRLTLQNVQPCHAGTYVCQVTNPAVPGMTLYCPSQVLAVPEPFQSCLPYEITTFPNPVENTLNFTITSPPDDVRMMRLSNMLGQIVWSRRFDEGDIINGLNINCADFPNGSYFLSLYTEGGLLSLTKRVQVLKK
jgi:Leucine-rich repeat (LRR) protein